MLPTFCMCGCLSVCLFFCACLGTTSRKIHYPTSYTVFFCTLHVLFSLQLKSSTFILMNVFVRGMVRSCYFTDSLILLSDTDIHKRTHAVSILLWKTVKISSSEENHNLLENLQVQQISDNKQRIGESGLFERHFVLFTMLQTTNLATVNHITHLAD